MKKYFVEFVGTFFLVFTIGNVAVAPGAGLFAPVAVVAVLAAMVYAGTLGAFLATAVYQLIHSDG